MRPAERACACGGDGGRAVALVAAAWALGAGCALEDRRALPRDDQARAAVPALGGGESESDVRGLLGPPDRVVEMTDEATGKRRTVYLYDRATDVNGSRTVRRIVIDDGRVTVDEEIADPRPLGPRGQDPTPRTDRTVGRDMDW